MTYNTSPREDDYTGLVAVSAVLLAFGLGPALLLRCNEDPEVTAARKIPTRVVEPPRGPCWDECHSLSLTTRGAISDQMKCNYCLEQQRRTGR